MIEANNPILSKMLDRLFVSMMDGPSMNCRPHASRQRMDLVHLEKLRDLTGGQVLTGLLGEGEVKVHARVPLPSRVQATGENTKATKAEEKAAHHAWSEQYTTRNKLRLIAEDARTYEQDTGVHALSIGFPIVNLPPGFFGRSGASGRRIVAPIAFLPVSLLVKAGAKQALELSRHGQRGNDLIVPNIALLAWIEQQSGRALPDLLEFKGVNAWKQLAELTQVVAAMLEIASLPEFESDMPADFKLEATPKSDEGQPIVVPAAVLGLFPSANEGLLRDTREMIKNGFDDGPSSNFIRLGVTL